MYPLQLTAEAIYARNVSLLFVAGFFLSLAKPQVRGDMGEIMDPVGSVIHPVPISQNTDCARGRSSRV